VNRDSLASEALELSLGPDVEGPFKISAEAQTVATDKVAITQAGASGRTWLDDIINPEGASKPPAGKSAREKKAAARKARRNKNKIKKDLLKAEQEGRGKRVHRIKSTQLKGNVTICGRRKTPETEEENLELAGQRK
jgi:hypothetical protein